MIPHDTRDGNIPQEDVAVGQAATSEEPHNESNPCDDDSGDQEDGVTLHMKSGCLVLVNKVEGAMTLAGIGFPAIGLTPDSVKGLWDLSAVDLHEMNLLYERSVLFVPDKGLYQDESWIYLVEALNETGIEADIVLLTDAVEEMNKERIELELQEAQTPFEAIIARITDGMDDGALEEVLNCVVRAIALHPMIAQNMLDTLAARMKLHGLKPPKMKSLESEIKKAGDRREKRKNKARVSPDKTCRYFTDEKGTHRMGYGKEPNTTIADFSIRIDEDVKVHDDLEPGRQFKGFILHQERTTPFTISATEYASDREFSARLYETAGVGIKLDCGLDELRKAVAEQNMAVQKEVTTDFGWTQDGSAYLTPSGVIKDGQWIPAEKWDGPKVDLSHEEQARHLDLQEPKPEVVAAAKESIGRNLVQLQEATLVYSLLAFAALAVLHQFSGIAEKLVLWIRGHTGRSKSFVARIVQCMFGNFTVEGCIGAFTSTVNFLERQSYFFRSALRLLDDYKADLVRPEHALRLMQNYTDGTSRGRLNADSSAKKSRPARGHLLVTGEDFPELSSSSAARCIIVDAAAMTKDLMLGAQVLEEAKSYPAFMSGFIGWVQTGKVLVAKPDTTVPTATDIASVPVIELFRQKVAAHRDIFYDLLKGRENDVRIAGNFALLLAAFEVFAAYMAPVWTDQHDRIRKFRQYLQGLAKSMVEQASDQAGPELFMSTLRDLINSDRAQIIEGRHALDSMKNVPIIGRYVKSIGTAFPEGDYVQLVHKAALAEVNKLLKETTGRTLGFTEATLLQQLKDKGWLIAPKGTTTEQVSIAGQRHRVLLLKREVLEVGTVEAKEKEAVLR